MAGATASNVEALDNLKAAGFPKDRPVRQIFWGTSGELFRPLDRAAAKRDLGLDYPFIVGGVGGLLPQKGFTILLAALSRLPASVHGVIIGSGPSRAELELWAGIPSLQGRIHLISQVPSEKMVEYLNCFDVLAVPSLTIPTWREQFGKVIAEAMACGTPVIGSNSGAIPEVIEEAGLIVPEGDPLSLADAIQSLYEHPERGAQLREKGLARFREEFSEEVFARKHVEFYGRLLNA
jgi:glycosyltransferase involved in cell wall biosynthesis